MTVVAHAGERDRALLRHLLAALTYRAQKALRGAPERYPGYLAGRSARTPVEILRHMTSLMGFAKTLYLGGAYPVSPEPLSSFDAEIDRFHQTVQSLADLIATGAPLREISTEQLLQGPISDAMTHVGQLAMLRRLADSPVAPENFIYAEISADRLGPDQALPARPDRHWPERPGTPVTPQPSS